MKKRLLAGLFIFCCITGIFYSQTQTEENAEIGIAVEKIGIYKCGKQPKQVLFSPDNEYVILPLLGDNGFDIFSVSEKKIIKRINPPQAAQTGFAEGLFIPSKKVFLVSQMTTANLYEYSYPDFTYKRTIPTEGEWSKFIAYSAEKNLLAVSNWISNNISLIDYDTGTVVAKINTKAAPRGMFFAEKVEKIISLSFDAGVIEKFDVESKKLIDSIKISKAAMRHIVVDSFENWAYVSDMYHRSVYKIDLSTFKIEKTTKVFNNPNTIGLLNDKYLFVSCRGPNNPEDYTKRSPVDGKICIIDVETMEIVKEIQGGNQPTGLDISIDGKLLCFSDFQDAALELYSIECK